jgi:hypothetical protein
MRKTFIAIFLCMLMTAGAKGQLQKAIQKEITSDSIKKSPLRPAKTIDTKSAEPATAPIYTLSAVKTIIRTGNDNKEDGATMLFFLREKDGIWGKGADLFQGGTKSELKTNSNYELILSKTLPIAAAEYRLENLQARGLYIAVYYSPHFFSDAWKIDAVTMQLEFKDQFGTLHPSFGNWTIQLNIANGLLTNGNWLLKATTDGALFTPSPAILSNKF